jgi:hypothetical protein
LVLKKNDAAYKSNAAMKNALEECILRMRHKVAKGLGKFANADQK